MSYTIGIVTGMMLFACNIVWGGFWIALIFWWQLTDFPDQLYYLAILRFISSHPLSCFVFIYPLLTGAYTIHYLFIFFAVVPVFTDLQSVLDIMLRATNDLSTPYGKSAMAIVWSAFGLSVLTLLWVIVVVIDQYCECCGWNCLPSARRKKDRLIQKMY